MSTQINSGGADLNCNKYCCSGHTFLRDPRLRNNRTSLIFFHIDMDQQCYFVGNISQLFPLSLFWRSGFPNTTYFSSGVPFDENLHIVK